jgi:hypothetical protein
LFVGEDSLRVGIVVVACELRGLHDVINVLLRRFSAHPGRSTASEVAELGEGRQSSLSGADSDRIDSDSDSKNSQQASFVTYARSRSHVLFLIPVHLTVLLMTVATNLPLLPRGFQLAARLSVRLLQ